MNLPPLVVDAGYWAAGVVAAPLLVAKSRRTGKYRSDWPARFGGGPDLLSHRSRDTRVLLLHCVSVGELNSVQTLIDHLLAADSNLHIAVTSTTDTGAARAQALFGNWGKGAESEAGGHLRRVHPIRFPLDLSFAVEALFDRVRPDAIALVELETWPNFLSIAHSRRIPVALINGRISDRSLPRYQWIRPLMKGMLQRLDFLGVQTPTIGERFRALGAPPDRLEVIPTLKYDNAQIADSFPGQEALAQAMGLRPDQQLLVAGSVAPGEESALLQSYLALREKYPRLRLAMAPRHPQAVPLFTAAIREAGLTPVRRTARPDEATLSTDIPLQSQQVFVLDTMGELKKLYALAFAVFVGRSLIPLKRGGGGSDMIEAAALAKPCIFGPHTSNFAETVELLTAHRAAIVVEDAAGLTHALESWLCNPATAVELGRLAQSLIANQRGSTQRYVQRILSLCHRRR